MSIVVFWIDEYEVEPGFVEATVDYKFFKDAELSQALSFTESLRRDGMRHVTISSELSDQVGKSGVSSIENGMTPDGHAYEWSKQHRGSRGAKTS